MLSLLLTCTFMCVFTLKFSVIFLLMQIEEVECFNERMRALWHHSTLSNYIFVIYISITIFFELMQENCAADD